MLTVNKLNIESQIIYKDILDPIKKFRFFKPDPTRLKELIGRHFDQKIISIMPSLINKTVKKFIQSSHCERYDSLYKELIYEIIQTKYLKLLKNIIQQIDDNFINNVAQILKLESNYSKVLYSTIYTPEYSQLLNPLLTISMLFYLKHSKNIIITPYKISYFADANEFSVEKDTKDLFNYLKEKK